MTNDECVLCGAPYHTGRRPNGTTTKLTRTQHLAHVSQRIRQAIKSGKNPAGLLQHEARLATDAPCGAVKYVDVVHQPRAKRTRKAG